MEYRPHRWQKGEPRAGVPAGTLGREAQADQAAEGAEPGAPVSRRLEEEPVAGQYPLRQGRPGHACSPCHPHRGLPGTCQTSLASTCDVTAGGDLRVSCAVLPRAPELGPEGASRFSRQDGSQVRRSPRTAAPRPQRAPWLCCCPHLLADRTRAAKACGRTPKLALVPGWNERLRVRV